MKINSVKFIKGIVEDDAILNNGTPQIAFIGRSNVGKSSLVNALTNSKISRTSSSAGLTREINFFLINDSVYFVDLPGYGYARASGAIRDKLATLIDSYFFNRIYTQKKVVLIIDINVGMTDKDIAMFNELKEHGKKIVIVLGKVDKITQKDFHKNMKEIEKVVGEYPTFQVSAKNKIGIDGLVEELLS